MGRELRKSNGKLNGSRPKPAPAPSAAPSGKACEHPSCKSTKLWKRSGVCEKHLDWARWSLPAEPVQVSTVTDLNALEGALPLGEVSSGRECATKGCKDIVEMTDGKSKTGRDCRACYNKHYNETLEINKTKEFQASKKQKQVLSDYYLGGVKATTPVGSVIFQNYLDTAAYKNPAQASVYENYVDSLYTKRTSRGRVELICTPDNGDDTHTYDGRISGVDGRVQKGKGTHLQCKWHQKGTGGYTTKLTGFLYLLRRPSMIAPEVIAYKENGVDHYWDYQYGISNVPRERLHDHIRSSGWEVVELRKNDNGKLALALETMVSRARRKAGYEYYALDKNDGQMSGRTESFKEEDHGKPVGTINQLIQWAVKETGEYETAEHFVQMKRVSKDDLRALLTR